MGSIPEPTPRRKRLRDDDDDAMDPDYQRFFDHLRVDGKSYVLELSPSSLKYEREEDSAREDLGNSRGSGSLPRSSMADESYRVFLDNLRVNGDSMTLELEDGLVVYEFGGGGMGREEQREFSVPCAPLVDESPFVDKDYGMFLGCAKTCGYAMVVKLPNGVTLEYEGGGGGEEDGLPNETEDLVNDSSTQAIETDFSAQSSKDSGSEHEGSSDGNVNYRLSSFGGGGIGREEQEQEREFSISCAPLVDESPFVDKDYGMFLGCAEMCGHVMVVKLPNGVTLEYEGGGGGEEEGLPNETEDLVNDSSTQATETNFSAQSSEDSGSEHEGSSDGNVNYRLSSFEDRLREHLGRPFNQGEYDKLKKLATTQKPKVKWRHLRCFDIPYKTNDFGPSYFGYYRDLAEQVESADHFRGLELLRGFFFWIENLGHEGAYKPWVSRRSVCKNYHTC